MTPDSEWEHVVSLMRMDPGEMGSDPANAARLLLRLASAQTQQIAQLRGYLGLSLSELYAVLTLWDRGRTSMSDLAQRVDMSRAAITTMADRIEAEGYVERGPDPHDRRRVLITVTAKLERMLEKHLGDHIESATRIAEDAAEWSNTARTIAKLRADVLTSANALRDRAPRRSRSRRSPDQPRDDPSTYW
jgi:DNA-binding MarR family transcriptional regulator